MRKKYLRRIFLFTLLIGSFLIAFIISGVKLPNNSEPIIKQLEIKETPQKLTIEKTLETNTEYSFDIPDGYNYIREDKIPDFIEITEDKIVIKSQKYSVGIYVLNFDNSAGNIANFIFHIESPKLDFESLEAKINEILVDKKDDYTIHLKNLLNEQRLDIQQGKIVEPASIAKLPIAVLVLRDIDAGKITLEDTYPFNNATKYGSLGAFGDIPTGTKITFRRYLEELIHHSDNNAWFMLVDYIGGSYQVANPRTIEELGVNPLFLDPPQGTAQGVGKILSDIYNHVTLSEESAEYLINLMENADEWARDAIGQGIPSEAKFVNKIGTLDDSGKSAYEDGAIIWGKKTDYVLVIMNENTDWTSGKENLKKISEVIYKFLNE